MNRRQGFLLSLAAYLLSLLIAALWANAAEAPQDEMQERILIGPDSAKRWAPAESTIETSNTRSRGKQPALHWHITVDHFAGEPNYPIVWPRIGYMFREASERDWTDWDYLQMWVYTETNRSALPREPAGLSIQSPDKEGAYNRALTELKKGQWMQIRIPLKLLGRRQDVRLIQLHISESNYRHQDQLDFYLDEIALLRYARPTLIDFAAETAVMFADARQIPVRFELAGVKTGDSAEVTCELREGRRVMATTAVKAMRGPQRLALDLTKAKLRAGDYEVVGRVAGGSATGSVRVRVVESPWQTAEARP